MRYKWTVKNSITNRKKFYAGFGNSDKGPLILELKILKKTSHESIFIKFFKPGQGYFQGYWPYIFKGFVLPMTSSYYLKKSSTLNMERLRFRSGFFISTSINLTLPTKGKMTGKELIWRSLPDSSSLQCALEILTKSRLYPVLRRMSLDLTYLESFCWGVV